MIHLTHIIFKIINNHTHVHIQYSRERGHHGHTQILIFNCFIFHFSLYHNHTVYYLYIVIVLFFGAYIHYEDIDNYKNIYSVFIAHNMPALVVLVRFFVCWLKLLCYYLLLFSVLCMRTLRRTVCGRQRCRIDLLLISFLSAL